MLLCHILLLIMQLRTHYTKYWTSEKGHWILTNSPVTLNITLALSPFPPSLGIFNLQSEAEKFNSTDGGNIRLWSASAKAPSSPHSHDSPLFAGLKPSQQDSGCLAPAPCNDHTMAPTRHASSAPSRANSKPNSAPAPFILKQYNYDLDLELEPLPSIGARVREAERLG